MSPQRRKGRGGGAGKVVALPPQIDSLAVLPPLQKHHLAPHCKSSLATVVSASSRKSSITPILSHSTSVSVSAKAKLKEKCQSAKVSARAHTLLSAAGLCDAIEAAKCKTSTAAQGLSRPNGVSKARKCNNSIDRQKNSHVRPVIIRSRTRSGPDDLKEGKKASKVSVLSSHREKSYSRSQSCRNSLQNEDLGECLRWSLPSQPKRIYDIAGMALSVKQQVPEKCESVEEKELVDVPLSEPSTDRRFSFGSSVMSMATSSQSADEDGLDKDNFTGVTDKFTDEIGVKSAVAFEQWPIRIGPDAHKTLRNSAELEIHNMEAHPCGSFKVLVEPKIQQTISSSENGEHEKAASQLLSNAYSVLPNADVAFAFGGQEIPDNIPSFSNSLQQRLALLEGRVSHITSELRKTKELLDSNSSSKSAALLSDIHGRIVSIEQAMTVRISNCDTTLPEDADLQSTMDSQTSDALSQRDPAMFLQMKNDTFPKTCEYLKRQTCLENAQEDVFNSISYKSDGFEDDQQDDLRAKVESHTRDAPFVGGVDTGNYSRMKYAASSIASKSSVMEWCHQNPQCHVSRLTSRKFDMLEAGQEELEDRLFPHRKLLKNLKSLHDGVAESRAALHSKLENGLPQVFDAAGNVRTLCAGMLKSGDMTDYRNANDFTKDDPSTNLEIKHGLSNINIYNEYAAKSAGRLGASWQGIPGIEATGSHDLVPAENFLECDESLPFESSATQESLEPAHELELESDEDPGLHFQSIGKRVSTAGWYACDGEAIVLVHDDGCCSFYDVANMEEKALYQCPEESPGICWNDCWLIRAAGSDGRANKYIVAATSGSALDAGFCSWDFHSRDVAAYHVEDDFSWLVLDDSTRDSPTGTSPKLSGVTHSYEKSSSKANAGLSLNGFLCSSMSTRASQRWYKPCGPLIASAGSFLKHVVLYDVRDGESIMTLETKQPILSLDFSSPLQWRNRGKLALAEDQAISFWDVNKLDAHCLNYIQLLGKTVCAFHMHNADAEYSGGVRQRLSSSDMEAFDGICCTQSDINILDLRVPNGIGLCLPIIGQIVQSVFSRGDVMITGGLSRASDKCEMQQWSVRKGRPICTYAFRASHSHHMNHSLRQVWCSSSSAMAVNDNGLHLFQGYKETPDEYYGLSENVTVGDAQELLNPSFDYANSQILLISGDRPASWCYWPR